MFLTSPVSDPEHRGADHHWLQFVEGGEFFKALYLQELLMSGISAALLCSQYCPRVLAELSDLQEFYDPDTVELITWIRWVI